jgi:hypothetical protein
MSFTDTRALKRNHSRMAQRMSLCALGRQKFIAKVRHSRGEPRLPPFIGIRPSLFTLPLLSWEFGRI